MSDGGSSDSSLTTLNGAANIEVSPDPPLAPNWNDNMEDTILSMCPYKLFPVAADSLEYTTIDALMDPFEITAAEQIVNPMLWSRFINERKERLLSKSDDLALLSKLSSDQTRIVQQMQIASTYEQDASVAACPYNDNVALLFHCTKDPKNVDTILLQGLDERVGIGGLLGRGIYFASDPLKSMAYDGCGGNIFIFMVFLGDCLSVGKCVQNCVMEPQKTPEQQRNTSDISFDSIVGRPGAGAACEYVVYNRYQCCPLYKISYKPGSGNAVLNGTFSKSKNTLPPFRWRTLKNATRSTPRSTISSDWPLFAKNIFVQMGAPQIQARDDAMDVDNIPPVQLKESVESINEKMAVLTNLGFVDSDLSLDMLKKHSYDLHRAINALLEASADAMLDESQILINNKLATLSTLGFTDDKLNAAILKKHAYDLNWCVAELLEKGVPDGWIDNAAASQFSATSNGTGSEQLQKTKFEDCEICSDEIDATSMKWKILHCGHQLCDRCYEQIETTRTTMTGISHTFVKCPFCASTSGIEIGTCPDGTMTTSIVDTPCQGYEDYQSIRIQYVVQCPGYQLHRIAFLPANDEGNEMLQLLQIAWDRRMCFATGSTSGQENILVWNIHHKTAQNGGVATHGYPDGTFMNRCKSELKAFGIK